MLPFDLLMLGGGRLTVAELQFLMRASHSRKISVSREEIKEMLSMLTKGPTLDWYSNTIEKIKEFDRNPTLQTLQDLLRDPDADIRAYAGEVLLQIDADTTLPFVLKLLEDPNASTRYNITRWLGEYPDERSVAPLIEVLLKDTDADVRSTAAIALRFTDHEEAVSALKWVFVNDFGTNFEGETVSSVAQRVLAHLKRMRP